MFLSHQGCITDIIVIASVVRIIISSALLEQDPVHKKTCSLLILL